MSERSTVLLLKNIRTLQTLIGDLSGCLTDEGDSWSADGLCRMRKRVANSLPPDICPDWLEEFRDQILTQT